MSTFDINRRNLTTYKGSHVNKNAPSANLHTHMESIIISTSYHIVLFKKYNLTFVTERIKSTYPRCLFTFVNFPANLHYLGSITRAYFNTPPTREGASVYRPCIKDCMVFWKQTYLFLHGYLGPSTKSIASPHNLSMKA